MLESAHNKAMQHHAHSAFPGAVIIKHCDSATKGVPDLSLHWLNQSFYFEAKVVRAGSSLADEIDPAQRNMCDALYRATSRCFFVVYFDRAPDGCETRGPVTAIFRPDAVNVLLTHESNANGFTQILHVLARHGVVWVNGHQHDLICQLVTDFSAFGRGYAH